MPTTSVSTSKGVSAPQNNTPASGTVSYYASLPGIGYILGFIGFNLLISNTKFGKVGTGLLAVAILFQLQQKAKTFTIPKLTGGSNG